jgi:sporulation protein YlmC with PRC-barrel domain
MRFSDLYRARVRTSDGALLGRVRAVHVSDGKLTELGLGGAALLHRLTRRARERRIAWDKVIALKDGEIIVEG